MTIEETIQCPLCSNILPLSSSPMNVKYQGNEYNVTAYFYRCIACEEDFTTTESDSATLGQVPNSIWSKSIIDAAESRVPPLRYGRTRTTGSSDK